MSSPSSLFGHHGATGCVMFAHVRDAARHCTAALHGTARHCCTALHCTARHGTARCTPLACSLLPDRLSVCPTLYDLMPGQYISESLVRWVTESFTHRTNLSTLSVKELFGVHRRRRASAARCCRTCQPYANRRNTTNSLTCSALAWISESERARLD